MAINQCYGSHLCGVCQDAVKTAKWLTELDIMENFDHRVPHNFLSIEEFEEEHKRHKIAMVLAHYCMMVRSEERDETMDKFRPWSVSMQHPTIIYPNTAENCKMLGIPRIVEEQECIECGSLFAGASSSDYCESCIRDAANIVDVDYVSTKCKGLRELGKEDWERIHGKGTFEYKEIPD